MHRFLWHHSKNAAKKTGHLLFPWLVHYLTDKYGDRHHHVIVDTIFGTAVLILIAFNIGMGYWFWLFTTPANLNINLRTPNYIISGSEVTYYVDYHNISRDVSDVTFELAVPDGFNFISSNLEAVNEADNIFYLGDLNKYGFGELQITGILIGEVGVPQKVSVLTRYKYHGQDFSELTAHSYDIYDTSLELNIEMPEHILNNEEFQWKVHYQNSSDISQSQTKFKIDLPNNLTLTQTPENYNTETQEITLEQVNARAAGELVFKGVFSGATGDSNTLIGVSGSFNADSHDYMQMQSSDSVTVLTPRLRVTSSLPIVASIGNNFTYQINCNNIGDAELTNVKVTANVDGGSDLDLSLYAIGGSVSSWQGHWTIASILPGESKAVYLSVTAPNYLRKQNLSLSFSSSAVANIEDLSVTTYSESSSASVKFDSTLDFFVESRYYGAGGEQLGYGPYPLEAGEITALRVFWNVRDFTNNLNNVTISTTLPSQVEWTGLTSVSQGADLTYDEKTRKITWHTSRIPAFSGPQGATFEVRAWPNSEQIGKHINITNETQYSAQDSFTNTIITKNLGALKTKEVIE